MSEYLKDLSIQIIGAALGGAIAICGAWHIYKEQKLFEGNANKQKDIIVLAGEVKNIIESSEAFLSDTFHRQNCDDKKGESAIEEGKKRAAFIIFDLTAWNSRSTALEGQEHFKYARFYSEVIQANYIAKKIQYGFYQKEEGVLYVESVLGIYEMGSSILNLENTDSIEKYEFDKESLKLTKYGILTKQCN